MPHDFVRFPELTNRQMNTEYFNSPHRQITEDFRAEVIKVHDGDTITVRWKDRDFDFPIRLININAPEMNEGGEEAQSWLENKILFSEVDILINPTQRVGKWGRLLGVIINNGININEEIMNLGLATEFTDRNTGQIDDIDKMLLVAKV